MTMPHVLCAAPSYLARFGTPSAPAEIRDHNCIQFTLSGHVDEWRFRRSDVTQAVSVPVNGRYKVTSSLAVRDALLAGFSLSLIPWLYVREEIKEGRLQMVLEDWTAGETEVYAIYPSRRFMMAKVRAFLDFLVSELAPASLPAR